MLTCKFCNQTAGCSDVICHNCKRPFERSLIAAQVRSDAKMAESIEKLQAESVALKTTLERRERIDAFLSTLMKTPEVRSAVIDAVNKQGMQELLNQL